jgi:transcriptional regulator with XRE-family HTH domain
MGRPHVGTLVKDWRHRRNLSQMDLALKVYVSTRHLSFVETGRSGPSPELLLAIAGALDVPLRQRNALLLAGGYAPRFTERPLDDPAMAPVRRSIQRMLDAHDPYPGVVIDRAWNVVVANRAALALVAGLPPALSGPPLNVYRACLHPDGLAASTVDFAPWADYLLGQLHRAILLTGDERLVAIEAEVRVYPNVAVLGDRPQRAPEWDEPPLLVPLTLRRDGGTLSLFTTLTTFGTPRDVTLEELSIELFFPADDRTEEILRRPAGAARRRS